MNILLANSEDEDQVSCFAASDLGVHCFLGDNLFRKILSGIPSECQTDWIQIRTDILSGLIWVQNVCKG